MKPLNHTERTTRLWKFTLYYVLALALPLVASYYLFSNDTVAEENKTLKRDLERTRIEQHKMLTQLDTLTGYLQRIEANDRQLRVESNDLVVGDLNKKNEDHLNSIAVTLSELRRDSTTMQYPTSKRFANNMLRDFDLFRSNRNTVDFLRKSLDKSGINTSDREQLAAELAQTKQLLATYQATAAAAANNRPAPTPRNDGGGGGGSRGGNSGDLKARLEASTDQVAFLSDQVKFANADCLRLRAASMNREQRKEMLEQSRKGFVAIVQNPSSDDMKETVMKMIDMIDKELGRKRGLFGYK
jgi:hypothetical protein